MPLVMGLAVFLEGCVMQASELRPGQFFEWANERWLYVGPLAHNGLGMRRVSGDYIESNVPWGAEVNPNVPQCWEGEGPDMTIVDRLVQSAVKAQRKFEITEIDRLKSFWQGYRNAMKEAAGIVNGGSDSYVNKKFRELVEVDPGPQRGPASVAQIEVSKESESPKALLAEEPSKEDLPRSFAAGDWVVCVELVDGLEEGRLYEVAEIALPKIKVKGYWPSGGYFFARRFRHATPAEIEQHVSQGTLDADKDLQPSGSAAVEAVTVTGTLQLREGGWYQQLNGHVVGPCKPFVGQGTESEYKWTMENAVYTNDGWTDYGPWRIAAEVPPPQQTEPLPEVITDWTVDVWRGL